MKKRKGLLFLVAIVLLALYVLVESVNLNPLYSEGAFFWATVLSVFILIATFIKHGPLYVQKAQQQQENSPFPQNPLSAIKITIPKWTKISLVVIWGFILAMTIVSSPLISWGSYRSQLGEPEIKVFSEDMQAVDLSQVPIVDQQLAYTLANKKLGERPGLGSQVMLGEPTIQQVGGKLVWAVPLHHSGFFKWLTNMEGTPGYIIVSATNVNDVQYVEGHPIKYMPYGAYLFDDLTRYVRFTSSLFGGITDYSFELNDDGEPYWVVTTYQNRRGFALPEATGAILINASTGAWTRHTIADMPEWVDRVQPENFIINQIDNNGTYVHGIFNFSNKDKYRSSQGHAIVYNGGDCYLFTGLTSVGADDSAIGFVMVNMVNKQVYKYQISGATESAAQLSANGKVQNLRYQATFPLIVNIDGQPTYFMTLKDDAGLIKQYAFVSVVNYSIVGTGETITDATNDYARSLKNGGVSSDLSPQGEKKSVTAVVDRIAAEYNGSETVYKLLLRGQPQIFIAPATLSDELTLTQVGDSITLEFYDSEPPIQTVVSFDNTAF